jgi:hypothetical protein
MIEKRIGGLPDVNPVGAERVWPVAKSVRMKLVLGYVAGTEIVVASVNITGAVAPLAKSAADN